MVTGYASHESGVYPLDGLRKVVNPWHKTSHTHPHLSHLDLEKGWYTRYFLEIVCASAACLSFLQAVSWSDATVLPACHFSMRSVTRCFHCAVVLEPTLLQISTTLLWAVISESARLCSGNWRTGHFTLRPSAWPQLQVAFRTAFPKLTGFLGSEKQKARTPRMVCGLT